MKKIYPIFTILIVFLFIDGCDHDRQLKETIKNYQGDGQIEYLEAPGFFGKSGCSITMSSFDLSEGLHANYSVSGIPASNIYVVYLVVDKPPNEEPIQQGVFSYQIKVGDKILTEVSASLREFRKTNVCNDYTHSAYYFKDPFISMGNTDAPITITVYLKDMKFTEQATAYIQIKFGGFK